MSFQVSQFVFFQMAGATRVNFFNRRKEQGIAARLFQQVDIIFQRNGILPEIFWIIELGGIYKNAAYQ